MARARKPTALHLVEDTHRTHEHKDRVAEPDPTGRPIKPTDLLPREQIVWDMYFDIAYWLTSADTEAYTLWCKMTGSEMRPHWVIKIEIDAEGKIQETKFLHPGITEIDSARLAQWRMLAQELGFTPGARSKINDGGRDGKPKKSAKFIY